MTAVATILYKVGHKTIRVRLELTRVKRADFESVAYPLRMVVMFTSNCDRNIQINYALKSSNIFAEYRYGSLGHSMHYLLLKIDVIIENVAFY